MYPSVAQGVIYVQYTHVGVRHVAVCWSASQHVLHKWTKYASSHCPINSTSRRHSQPLKVHLPSQAKVEWGATNSDETICVWNQQDQTSRGNEDTVADLDKHNQQSRELSLLHYVSTSNAMWDAVSVTIE